MQRNLREFFKPSNFGDIIKVNTIHSFNHDKLDIDIDRPK